MIINKFKTPSQDKFDDELEKVRDITQMFLQMELAKSEHALLKKLEELEDGI